MDPFDIHQQMLLQNVPGGFPGQLAMGQMLNVASQNNSMGLGTPMMGATDAYQTMLNFQQQQMNQRLLQQTYSAQSASFANAMGGVVSLAGREITPQMNQVFGTTAELLTPLMTQAGMQSQLGRSLLDMVSPNQMAFSTMAVPIQNALSNVRDPFSGHLLGNLPETNAAITERVISNLGGRVQGPGGEMMGPVRTAGFSGAQIGEVMYNMQRRGELPSVYNMQSMIGNRSIENAREMGVFATSSSVEATLYDSLSPGDQILAGQNLIDPESGIRRGGPQMRELGFRYGIDSRQDFIDLHNETRAFDPMRLERESYQIRVAGDKQAASAIGASLDEAAEYNEYLDGRGRIASFVGKGFFGYGTDMMYTDPGGYRRDENGKVLRDEDGNPLLRPAAGIPIGDVFAGTVDTLAGVADYAASFAFSGQYGTGSAIEDMDEEEFNRRLLKVGAATGSSVGMLDPETATDMAEALRALKDSDIDAFASTDFGGLSNEQRIAMISEFTSLPTNKLLPAIAAMDESELDSMVADDPFSAAAGSQFQQEIAEGRQKLRGFEASEDFYQGYADELSRALEDRLKVYSAVRDLITDPAVKNNIGAIMEATDEILAGSMNQMSGQQASRLTRELVTMAQEQGMTIQGLGQLGQVGGQIAGQAGLERAYAPRITQQLMLGESVFGGKGLAVNALGVYGMANAAEMSTTQAAMYAESTTSDNAQAIGTILRLRDRAGEFDESTAAGQRLNRLAAAADEGRTSEELTNFLGMDRQQQLSMLREATGESDSFLLRELDNTFSNEGRLQEGLGAEAVFAANQQTLMERDLPAAMDEVFNNLLRDTEVAEKTSPEDYDRLVSSISDTFVDVMDTLPTPIMARAKEGGEATDIAAADLLQTLDERDRGLLVDALGGESEALDFVRGRLIMGGIDNASSRLGMPFEEVMAQSGSRAVDRRLEATRTNRDMSLVRDLFAGSGTVQEDALRAFLAQDGDRSGVDMLINAVGVDTGQGRQKVQQVRDYLERAYNGFADSAEFAEGDEQERAKRMQEMMNGALEVLEDVELKGGSSLADKLRSMREESGKFADGVGGRGEGTADGDGGVKLNNVNIYLADGTLLLKGANGSSGRGDRGGGRQAITN